MAALSAALRRVPSALRPHPPPSSTRLLASRRPLTLPPSPHAYALAFAELKYLETHELRARFDAAGAADEALGVAAAAQLLAHRAGAPCAAADAAAAAVAAHLSADGKVHWPALRAAADEAAAPVDARVRPIYASLVLTFVAHGIQFPVLPQLARSLELTTTQIGYVSSASALARLALNVPASIFAERVGRRPLLIAGPAVSGVGMALLSTSGSLAQLLLANACIGAGMAGAMAGASLYLADISTPRNRAQTTAPILQSALVGYSVGPATGGALATALGLHAPFGICAAGLGSASLVGGALLPETLHEAAARNCASRRAADDPPVMQMLLRPALQGLHAVVFMNGFGQGAMPITLVLFAVEEVHMSSAGVGMMLTANVFLMGLATAATTRLSDRVSSRKYIMAPAIAATACFTALQPLAAPSPLAFAGLVACTGLCNAIWMPSVSPLLLDFVSGTERAKAFAMRQTAQDAGHLFGAASMGLVANAYGTAVAIEAVAALQAAAVIFFAIRVPANRRAS